MVRVEKEEGEWTEVSRRRNRNTSNHQANKQQSDYRVVNNKKDFFLRKATTYYISNFPEVTTEADIWRVLTKQGKVVDVYIARKVNKLEKRFGFVRFVGITDSMSFVKKLRSLRIGRERLFVSIAKFEREKRPVVDGRKKTSDQRCPPHKVTNNLSYADAVGGTINGRKEQPPHTKEEFPMIKFTSQKDSNAWARKTLVGTVQSYEQLLGVNNIIETEGLNITKMCYLGGLSVIMEFPTKNDAVTFLVYAKDTWRNWFNSLRTWDPECKSKKRFASLYISGVPPHIWTTDTYSEIAKTWGEVAIPEACAVENTNMSIGKVVILTEINDWINVTKKIMVDDVIHEISIIEDRMESVKFNPFHQNNDDLNTNEDSDEEDGPSFHEDESVFSEDDISEFSDSLVGANDQPLPDDENKRLDGSGEEEQSSNHYGSGSKIGDIVVQDSLHESPDKSAGELNIETNIQVGLDNNLTNGLKKAEAQGERPKAASDQEEPKSHSFNNIEPITINKSNIHNRPKATSKLLPFPLKPISILRRNKQNRACTGSAPMARFSGDGGSNVSIDLNKQPSASHVSESINMANHASSSSGTSAEIRNTMDVGNIIGFNMDGFEKEISHLISKNGDVRVNQ